MKAPSRSSQRPIAIALGALLALPSAASADVCELMDRATAEASAARLREVGTMVYLDWFAPVAIEAVEVRPYEDMFEVVVNGAIVPDIAYTYVPGEPGTYRNLGLEVGCEGADVTPVVPDVPFATATGAPPARAPLDAFRLLGALELPDLFEPWLAGDVAAEPIEARAAPSYDAPVVASTRRFEDFALLEFSYEETGVAVHGQVEGWYAVRLDGADGWIPEAKAGPFHPVAELLDENLVYLEATWSGEIFEAPDRGAARVRLDEAWRRMIGDTLDVAVLELRDIDGELWVRLDVLWPGPCFGDEVAAVASGWVPAYGPTGGNDVWFFSRGC